MRPVFIGGLGRSGTTLLADVLGCHPELTPIYETDCVPQVMRTLFGRGRAADPGPAIRDLMDDWTRDLPHRPSHKRAHERYVHGDHHLLFTRDEALAHTNTLLRAVAADRGSAPRAVRAWVLDLFDAHCRHAGKPRWVNKTPMYLHAATALRAVFPDMLLVHTVRDGRDVAASAMTRRWGPSTIDEAARWWTHGIALGRAFGARHPDQYVEVRYEDVLRRPEATLARLLATIESPPAAELAQAYPPGFDDAPVGRHRQTLPAADVDRFEHLAGPTLATLGYA